MQQATAPTYSAPTGNMPALQACNCGQLAYGPAAPTTRAHRGRKGLAPTAWLCAKCCHYYATACGW